MRLTMSPRLTAVIAGALVLLVIVPALAFAHEERHAEFPDGNGTTPRLLTAKTSNDTLLVCKSDSKTLFSTLPIGLRERNQRLYQRCMDHGFRHIQAAVDAVQHRKTRILVLPGVYREEPSLRAHREGCDNLDGQSNGDEPGTPSVLTYRQQRRCPHVQNLITIFGDSDGNRECDLPQCGLQIQGTGRKPSDVVLDGGFKTLNGIRADRVDGVRFDNFALQRFEFNALYILETDGFLIHDMLGRWNDEYAYLTFASDHGLYNGCEAYGNGDSGVYPGSASDLNTNRGIGAVPRYALEIRHCRGHHNALGYSGTAGNSVWAHDNQFDNNAAGMVTDSIYPDHPGLPQDHARFSDNKIFSNNTNYFRYVKNGVCDRPFMKRDYEHGVVCPVIPAPVGSGIVIAGGNYNKIMNNDIYDNWRTGTFQFNVPAELRNEHDPQKQFDTSHYNRYRGNRLGFGPAGNWQPNALDFWWDDQGDGNCWGSNNAKRGEPTDNALNPQGAPNCENPSQWVESNPIKLAPLLPCASYDRRGDETAQNPPGCTFFNQPDRPADREPTVPTTTRTRGKSAAGTAVGVSRRAFRSGSDAVVIARAGRQAAALAAAPLAGKVGGPLLLTGPGGLPRATADEVRRLDARRAYVVGNVPPRVVRTLHDIGVQSVKQLSGDTAFQTAAAVARVMGGTDAYIVRGPSGKHPDVSHAFGLAGMAASQQRPILFAKRRQLPAATRHALNQLDLVNATLFGGQHRMGAAVRKAVGRRVDDTDRIRGYKRFGLSAAAARWAVKGIADRTKLWVAQGDRSLDAVVAGAAVARRDGVLLTVDGDNLERSHDSRRWLRIHQIDVRVLTLVGGDRRISDRTAGQIRTLTH
jgi:hypothetical protein